MRGVLVYNIVWDITPEDLAELENERITVNDRVYWGLYELTKLPSTVFLEDHGPVDEWSDDEQQINEDISNFLSDNHGWFVTGYEYRFIEGEQE